MPYADPERRRAYLQTWKAANPDYAADYYKKHPEKFTRARTNARRACTDAKKARMRAYYAANKEKRKAYLAATAGARAAGFRAWEEKNSALRKAYKERNRDTLRVAAAAWAKQNSGRKAAACARYKAALLRATPSWLTEAHYAAINKCYVSGAQLGYHVDHIVPLQGAAVCGLHVPWNLQLLTPTANMVKGNRMKEAA